MTSEDAALQAYYARDKERDRLATGVGKLEFLRTIEVLERTIPAPPATVADIGGGPGRYTDWLVEHGYRVVHRDVVASHVEQVRQRHRDAVDSAVGDARALDLDDGSVDLVLLLGPIYHLREAADRVAALREAARVVRPGGRVQVAAITRWSARLHGILVDHVHESYPAMFDVVDEVERTGWLPPVVEGGFNGYTHTPAELREEVASAGLELESLVAVEGIGYALGDLDERLDDPAQRALLLDTLRAVEAVPDLLGLGPHLLATCLTTPEPNP
jgi:SAM-dependent methyltransferase